ncbi:MAG: TraB/GumN family protein [Thermodesulfobacteriota bacterium]
MTSIAPTAYPPDVHRLMVGGREILLVGTAHVSRESADLVRLVIENERPDCVCIELDEKRYEALAKRKRWEILDLKEIIRTQQLATLLVNMVLAAYQKRLGDQLGVPPGTELLEAAKVAEAHRIPVALCDRDVRITMRRAWHSTSFFRKNYLLATLIASMFDSTEVSEEGLRAMKESDVLSELLNELGTALPEIKQVLIDERDTYLAEKIKEAGGQRIVAVVGAGHVAGIKQALLEDRRDRMEAITAIPPASPFWKIAGWSIPFFILASLGYIGWAKGPAAAGDNALFWVLATGTPCAIGAMLALAHPLTIVSAFVAAPFTTLSPLIGVGHVTAFSQVMLRPPLVMELERVLDDMASLGGWWKNRLLRVFLVFMLPSLGGMIGTWIGGARILSNLF